MNGSIAKSAELGNVLAMQLEGTIRTRGAVNGLRGRLLFTRVALHSFLDLSLRTTTLRANWDPEPRTVAPTL